jgi:hypothetical protein
VSADGIITTVAGTGDWPRQPHQGIVINQLRRSKLITSQFTIGITEWPLS